MFTQPFFPSILHGADYNPEQWPHEIWDDDVALMQRAHCNVVSLPIFGWVNLQPDEDTFTFEWLDEIIEKLWKGGVSICLATATASVPAWLTQKYPDVLRVDEHGKRLKHGNRHTFCPNSPNFRRLAVGLARRIAQRYGHHPAVAVWHISNEYSPTCYCDLCAEAFRGWLRRRYGSLEKLNQRWYSAFWGHNYTAWSQIEPPTSDGERSNHGLSLDYDRFASQSLLDCFCAERDAVREFNAQIPVTTNLMGTCKPTDYHRWAPEMDIVSWDCYPVQGALPSENAFQHSLMRGLKAGQPWMLMEQTPSQSNWIATYALKRPGVMRLWSYQALAHGADTVMYFQWRRSRGACEKFHGAIVEHSGRPEARVFQEVAALGAELDHLGQKTLGGRVQSKVALLFDWENWWALEHASGPFNNLKYVAQCTGFYNALHTEGIVADVVSPDADLSGYDLVLAPLLYMVKAGVAEKLEAFVAGGGTFLTTYLSGMVDENDLVFENGYPGPLSDLLGLWVEEIDKLPLTQTNQMVFASPFGESGDCCECGLLYERIHAQSARVLATYGEQFYAGEAAFTVNRFGQGRAYYLATLPETKALASLLRQLCFERDITPPLGGKSVAGVEITARLSPVGETLFYVLNHNDFPTAVSLPNGKFTDLISDTVWSDELTMNAYDVRILQAQGQ